MNDERLIISSTTGVDVALPIAGPGSRSYAFVVDWHFRLLLALAWYVCASLLVLGTVTPGADSKPSAAYALGAVLPAFAIYFLYHPVLEVVMRGRTPGKRIAGVRLVTRSGGVPSTGALLIRNIFRLIDSMPAVYVVGLVACFVTDDRVRIGDLAAGTVLVNEEREAADALDGLGLAGADPRIDPAAAELGADLLRRWRDLTDARRTTLARALLARIGNAADREGLELADGQVLRTRLEALLGGAAARR
jgi:uncharacterized RDD family membrane protein YckC